MSRLSSAQVCFLIMSLFLLLSGFIIEVMEEVGYVDQHRYIGHMTLSFMGATLYFIVLLMYLCGKIISVQSGGEKNVEEIEEKGF